MCLILSPLQSDAGTSHGGAQFSSQDQSSLPRVAALRLSAVAAQDNPEVESARTGPSVLVLQGACPLVLSQDPLSTQL